MSAPPTHAPVADTPTVPSSTPEALAYRAGRRRDTLASCPTQRGNPTLNDPNVSGTNIAGADRVGGLPGRPCRNAIDTATRERCVTCARAHDRQENGRA